MFLGIIKSFGLYGFTVFGFLKVFRCYELMLNQIPSSGMSTNNIYYYMFCDVLGVFYHYDYMSMTNYFYNNS